MTALVTAEYQGATYSFQADGWFNATIAAKRYAKEPHEWLRLPETVGYVAALIRRYGKIPYVKTSRARVDRGGGTWLHPKLAVAFTRWLNVDFALWCDEQIDRLVRGEPLDEGSAEELTTVTERIPLLLAACHALDRHGLSLTVTYRAFNAAAGSERFRFMTKRQAALVVPVATRINTGVDTQDDWRLLRGQKPALAGGGQIEIEFAESTAYNPAKESS